MSVSRLSFAVQTFWFSHKITDYKSDLFEMNDLMHLNNSKQIRERERARERVNRIERQRERKKEMALSLFGMLGLCCTANTK